jgi:membrane-bound lytic murein transglycosylase C
MTTGPGPASRLRRRSFLLAGAALAAGCAPQRNAPTATSGAGDAGQASDTGQALREAMRRLASRCAQLWGRDNVALPSAKAWVSYNEDWTSRGAVDFEHGALTAQVLVDADTAAAGTLDPAIAELRQRLSDAATATPSDLAEDDRVAQLASELAGRHSPVAPAPDPAAKAPPVLAGILPENAQSELAPAALERLPVTGEDGRKRVMLTYRVPFRDGYFMTLAARYAGPVRRETRRHGLPPSLVYAVIETESAFNPRARSPVPAYGLMQLVPRSGGRDAYTFIHGTAREPDPEALYDPETNIALGAAYLKILGSRYLSAIEDAESRTYATIAAYNTGAGNVARAFDGTTRIASAARLINGLPPGEVLRRLKVRLPHEETRRYVAAVLERQGRYQGLDEA